MTATIVKSTKKAIAVKHEGRLIWLPRRRVTITGAYGCQAEIDDAVWAEKLAEEPWVPEPKMKMLVRCQVRETAKAVAVEIREDAVHSTLPDRKRLIWLPKSQITIDGDTITVPVWLWAKKIA